MDEPDHVPNFEDKLLQATIIMTSDIVTMQQFMWQLDIVGVAHFVMDCFDYLDAASSSNQP